MKKNKNIEESEKNLVTQFSATDTFKQVVEGVNNRLQFKDMDNFNARRDRVMNMYDLCRYEGIWKTGAKSPWCSVVIKLHKRVLLRGYD